MEAEFNLNDISEQLSAKRLQAGQSQKHLQKFGPSGFTMGMKTPVKKALGEKNLIRQRDKYNSNSNITYDGTNNSQLDGSTRLNKEE